MKTSKPEVSESRRRFLRDTSISGGAVLVAASTPATALANSEDGGAPEDKPEQGYRLTKHILAYYKSVAG